MAEETINHIGRDPVTCDSAEPKSIAELKQHGVNAKSAKKGKDSIVHGIQWFKQQTIVIDKSCINAKNEFQQYKWKEDKDGNAIRQPVDKMNNLIDAGRYAYEKDSTAGQKAKSEVINFYKPRKKNISVPAPAHSDSEIDRILKEVQQ